MYRIVFGFLLQLATPQGACTLGALWVLDRFAMAAAKSGQAMCCYIHVEELKVLPKRRHARKLQAPPPTHTHPERK